MPKFKRHHFCCCLSILVSSLFFSCEETVDWVFHPLRNEALVVEAIITDELKTQEIWLTRSYDDLNGRPVPVTDALVRFSGGGINVWFRADGSEPGRYVSDRSFAARRNTPYTLEIEWEGKNYGAESIITESYPINNKMTFLSVGPDSLVIGEVAPLYLPDEQAMYEVDITWSNGPNAPPGRAMVFSYTFSTIDVSELFRPPRETAVFPRGSMVVRRKYSLNPAFAAYLRALLLETEWQGGIFDEASGSLPTNISEGGFGFFAVCAVSSETLVAE